MKLNKHCFKIDQTNAKAMIDGYAKGGRRVRQSIWCAVERGFFPALITLNRTRTKFPMSDVGERLYPDTYSIPFKYVAHLPGPQFQYFVRNDMKLWERICFNGLFDVWDPVAPYNRFANSKKPKGYFRIQLLRIYEMNELFKDSDIVHANDRIDHLLAMNTRVTIKRPVISDEEFEQIRHLLEMSVEEFRIRSMNNA